jgi:putative photosynthetic complex assembly protein
MIVRTYEDDDIQVHRVPLMLMGGLVAISLALTASVTLGFFEKSSVPDEVRAEAGVNAIAQRSLNFYDAENGGVRVEDGTTGEIVAVYDPGTGGFVRSIVRSLAHERKIRGLGPSAPFTLVEWENGTLSLTDTATGKSRELAFFGPDNRRIFADMLKENR